MSMTSTSDGVEIITSVQRRRRWSPSEKVRMVEETFEPGSTVSLVARRHGVAPNQLFTGRDWQPGARSRQLVPRRRSCWPRTAGAPQSQIGELTVFSEEDLTDLCGIGISLACFLVVGQKALSRSDLRVHCSGRSTHDSWRASCPSS